MSMFDEPRKAKIAFGIALSLLIIFFLASGVLGYFFYKKYDSYQDIWSRYTSMKKDDTKDAEITDLEKQIEELTAEKTALEKENKELKDGIAVANAYNEFLKYMTHIIDVHNGFTGWTDAEYQVGRTKAQATGSTSFVNTVDWAWNRTDVDITTRVIGVWNAIATGIDTAI